jgi:hypothetical protein
VPNAIKYNTSAETLALKKGNFWIGTGDVGKGPTSSTGYYNGITPPSGGYTIYLNKVSGGPSIYVASSDAQLITLTNQIAGTSYTTANECFNYYAGQTDKIVLNYDYEPIITNGLVLNLDAGFIPSYPRNGATWYDLSGNGNHMTLVNGPTFTNNNKSSYISFDSSNDYGDTTVQVPDSNTGDRCCFDCWCYGPMTNITMLMAWGSQIHDIFIYQGGIGFNTYNSDVYGISLTPLVNVWFNITVNFYRGDYTQGSIYINGVQQSLSYYSSEQNQSNARFAGGQLRIGAGGDGYNGSWRFNNVKVYNRGLSTAEVLQNYNAQKGRFGL